MHTTSKAGRGTGASNRIAALRAQFPGADKWTYLETASTGIMPLATRDAIARFTDDCAEDGKIRAKWDGAVDGARERFARLINADPQDVSYTKNFTEGANIIANALPIEAGDNVAICGELEHPANVYPWFNLQSRGIEVRNVSPREQAIDVEALIAACDSRTRAVVIPTVTFAPGYRTDVAALSAATRERGIFLFVDATQSVGVLETDVEALGIDGLATSTYKYLLGLYGQGFLYCRREWANRLRPTFPGRYGMEVPLLHPGDDGSFAIRLAEGGRRLESGHMVLGSAALTASLDLLLEVGAAAIEAHVTRLATRLADGFEALGLPVNRDPRGLPPTQIVTVGGLVRADNYRTVEGPILDALHTHLDENRVRHSTRRGRLRFGFHLYNNEADVDRVLGLAEESIEAGGRAK